MVRPPLIIVIDFTILLLDLKSKFPRIENSTYISKIYSTYFYSE
jgi:hypothetical protein